MNFNEKFSEWKNTGTEPSPDLQTNGFQGGQKPPAAIFNWFWSKAIRAITEIQTKLINITKSDVGLGNVDNTSDADKPISNATQTALNGKVDKISGKGLSANDYTTEDKNKLSGIEIEANKYVLPNAGTELGGVKSGGDVNITDGIITVKDDSHNHLISNIDGLQGILDGKASTSHNHSANDINSGTLSSDRLPTVPITKGGTGATTLEQVKQNLGIEENNVFIATYNQTTNAEIEAAITEGKAVLLYRIITLYGGRKAASFGTLQRATSPTCHEFNASYAATGMSTVQHTYCKCENDVWTENARHTLVLSDNGSAFSIPIKAYSNDIDTANAKIRNTAIVSTETAPTNNGEICWLYE